MIDDDFLINMINHLLNQQDELQERLRLVEQERDEYHRQVKSYEMWMNRSIDRIKEMHSG